MNMFPESSVIMLTGHLSCPSSDPKLPNPFSSSVNSSISSRDHMRMVATPSDLSNTYKTLPSPKAISVGKLVTRLIPKVVEYG